MSGFACEECGVEAEFVSERGAFCVLHERLDRLNEERDEARALAAELLYNRPEPEDWGSLYRLYPWLPTALEWRAR